MFRTRNKLLEYTPHSDQNGCVGVKKSVTHTGVWRPPVGSSWDYMPVSMSICISRSMSLCLIFRISFWRSFTQPIILHMFWRTWKYLYESRNIWGGQIILIYKSIHILSPHWVPKDHSGVQSSLYVRPYVFLSLCLFVRIAFWKSFSCPVITRSICGRRPQGQSPWVAVQYFRLFVLPVIRRPFEIFVFVLISSVGVQRCDAFIPILGYKGPQWGTIELMCMCLCLSGCLRLFFAIICAEYNYTQIMQTQDTG